MIVNQFADPEKVRRQINRTGGILNRAYRMIRNGSFHNASTSFEVYDAPGEILDFSELVREMNWSIRADSQLIEMALS